MKRNLPIKRLKIKDLRFKNAISFFYLNLFLYLLFFVFVSSTNAQMLPPYGGGLKSGVYGGVNSTGGVTSTPTPIQSVPTQVPISQGPGTAVSARVGDLYLSLSGFSSPYSSIILISDGFTLRSTVSDVNGRFSLSEVLIKRGFSNFCLKAEDFRNLGDSTTCINIPPAKASVVIKDIFLPPTLGLWKNEVGYYQEALAFGYTMPQALVTLHISGGKTLTTKADKNGYFRFILKMPAGKYSLFATAKYQNIESKAPSKTVELHVLSAFGLIIQLLKDLINKFITLLTSLALGPLWLVIPIIILIIILITKLWKDKFTSIFGKLLSIFFAFLPHKKRLHHAWWVGY